MVKDNDLASQMAKRFHASDPDYQEDTKWWDLVEEEDRSLLGGTETTGGTGDELEGFGDETEDEAPEEQEDVEPPPEQEPVHRIALPSLSREYRHDRSDQRWDVSAWAVEESDPELAADIPWNLNATAAGAHEFFVNLAHEVFRSATLTPLDALLAQLAWSATDFLRGQPSEMPFALALADLRERFASTTKLDPVSLSGEAALALSDIAKALSERLDPTDARALFDEFSASEQDAILQKMATRQLADPQAAISAGRFLEHAPRTSIPRFFSRHPELFFDGHYWEESYSELDYGRPAATEEAKSQLVRYYEGLLADAIWLAEQDVDDLAAADRTRVLRASLALDLLGPSVVSTEA